jgi:hypothetical protein
VGVKVTLSESVPTAGVADGVVHANIPTAEAVPPLNVEEASVCPIVIALAVGHAVTDGVALATVSGTVLDMPGG